ncbi:cytochrome C biosynthesis protein [Sphingomonas sp.]|uniref:tetratricopeptide repeat protein n=1 Tax=Sphingomonas sp. TaxID=28214 RepID=UPI002D7F68F9|nr:cytochrome C biosynthesis protein [Sphingomonas sp.]HEU0045624.1 cytochrome C biosynthesis protein [Sphingomonas sp.]
MSGWIALFAIGGLAFAAMRAAGLARVYASLAGAALMLGGAGYAWQQRAGLPGQPVSAKVKTIEVEPGMIAFRAAIMPGTLGDREALAVADTRLRDGDATGAAAGLLRAIRATPGQPALWTGLGAALAAHDDGQFSPSARFAFQRAVALAPREPGPPFFLGMALARAGDLAGARTAWLRALALAPRNAPYRADIAERLVIIDQYEAMAAGA